MGFMNVLGKEGDMKVEWDKDNAREVAHAETLFKEAVEENGFFAFRISKKGKKREQIFDFDPKAERIVLMPQISGG